MLFSTGTHRGALFTNTISGGVLIAAAVKFTFEFRIYKLRCFLGSLYETVWILSSSYLRERGYSLKSTDNGFNFIFIIRTNKKKHKQRFVTIV